MDEDRELELERLERENAALRKTLREVSDALMSIYNDCRREEDHYLIERRVMDAFCHASITHTGVAS